MIKDLSIRPMTLEDLEATYALEVKCFNVPWTREAFKTKLKK